MGDDVGWSDGEEVVGLHMCTFKSATLAVWQYLCVCVLIFLFWRSLSSVPVKSCPLPPPPEDARALGMLTRAAASVNPAH